METATPDEPQAGERHAADALHRIVETIRRRGSTPAERREWCEHLLDLLPNPPGRGEHRAVDDANTFLNLCDHLAERSRSDKERERLIRALVDAEDDIGWADPLLQDLDAVLATVVNALYESLARKLAASDDPATAQALYERMRDHCTGLERHVVETASRNPHLSGRRIATDFEETVHEHAPVELLHKLEDENENGLLSSIALTVDAAATFLGRLKNPDRLVAHVVARARACDRELPQWLWEDGILADRFDLLRSGVPWEEITLNADRLLWARIENHIQEQLGSRYEQWETFHHLEDGFQGTLDDLVDVSRLL